MRKEKNLTLPGEFVLGGYFSFVQDQFVNSFVRKTKTISHSGIRFYYSTFFEKPISMNLKMKSVWLNVFHTFYGFITLFQKKLLF